MPRQSRLDAPGTMHHVIGRGIAETKIFRDEEDKKDFLSRLADLCERGGLIIYAWALMDNHFHLLARTARDPLAQSMRKLLTGYVIHFNRRHRRYGHLFQNRYKSIVCEDDPYLLELTRYIHLNPVRVGLVKNMEELSKYPWAGHSVLMGKVNRQWQDRDTVLAYFGRRKKRAMLRYAAFVAEGIAQGSRPALVGGGLIRSLGGWAQVVSVRRKGSKVSYDDRILGSSDFVESLLSEADKRERETLRFRARVRDLASLALQVARGEKVEESELTSGSRQRDVSRVRRLFCQLAVAKMGYPGAEVARFLGVTTSAVIRAANSGALEEVEKYL
jgi:putative transposase